VQLGAITLESLGNWRVALGGPCQNFAARVALLDQNNQSSFFLRADGAIFEKDFAVCAPGDLPQVTATLTGAPTETLTPVPGVFVVDLSTAPNPPTRGSDLSFDVSFSNTAGAAQTYRWLVYIYRPDDPTKSIGETTALQSEISAGASQVRSLGSWKLPLGGPCEDYVARVEWLDQNNQANIFNRPDGSPFEKKLTVCPP
jgi:hypothetical protein